MDTYILKKNDGRYVKLDYQKNISYTENISLAEKFLYPDAQKFYKNNINKKLKPYITIHIIDEGVKTDKIQCNEIISTSEINKHTIFDRYDYKWIDNCSNFCEFFSQLEDYKSKLDYDIRNIEDEFCDVRHKIEFPRNEDKEYNAVDGYNLFKLEREILRKRRIIKNEKKRVQIMLNSTLEDFKNGSVVKQLKNIENQKYTPKVLIKLFA